MAQRGYGATPPTRESLEDDIRGAEALLRDTVLLGRLPDKGQRIHDSIAALKARIAKMDEREAARRELAEGRARLHAMPLKVNPTLSAAPPQPMDAGEAAPTPAPAAHTAARPRRAPSEPLPAAGPEAAAQEETVGDAAPCAEPPAPAAGGKRAVRFDETAAAAAKAPPRERKQPLRRRAPTEDQLRRAEEVLKEWNVTRSSVADDRAPMLVQIETVMREDPAAGKRLEQALDVLSADALKKVQAAASDEAMEGLIQQHYARRPQPSVPSYTQRRAIALSTEESIALEKESSQRRAEERRKELLAGMARAQQAPAQPQRKAQPRTSYRDMFSEEAW